MKTAIFFIIVLGGFCFYHFTWSVEKKVVEHPHKFYYERLQLENMHLSTSKIKVKKKGIKHSKFEEGKLTVDLIADAEDINRDSVVVHYDFGKIYIDIKPKKQINPKAKKQAGTYTIHFVASGLAKEPGAYFVNQKQMEQHAPDTHLYAGYKVRSSWAAR